jgi:hypothetical protein
MEGRKKGRKEGREGGRKGGREGGRKRKMSRETLTLIDFKKSGSKKTSGKEALFSTFF